MGAIAQFRLPETSCPWGEFWRVTRSVGIVFHNFGGGRTCGDPVIELWRRLSHPPCGVVAQFDTTDPGIVPQQAIAPAREQEGNRNLRIALDQVDGAALLVESSMLVLSKPIEPFIIVGAEAHLQVKEVAMHCFKGPWRKTGGTHRRFLSQ